VGLISVANWWAWSLLAARVVSVPSGDELFTILSAPHMISGAVHERSSLHFFGSINSRVSSVNFLILSFRNFLSARAIEPFLIFAFLTALAFLPEDGSWL
jgi:hypothetical protein